MMESKKKNIFKKKIYLPDRIYYLVLFVIPIAGLLIKNLLLNAYMDGDNLYSPDFKEAIANTWKYWIFYVASGTLLLSIGLFLKSEKARSVYISVCNFLFTALISCDVIYIRSFFTLPSAADVLILKNFSGFDGGEVSSLLCKWDILLFLDIFLLALFMFIFKRKKENVERNNKKVRKLAMALAGTSILILVIIPLQAKALNLNKNLYEKVYESSNAKETNEHFSSIGFHFKDIYQLIREEMKNSLTEDERKMIEEYYEWKNEKLPNNQYAGMYEGKNVLFLQIESLESFVIGQTIEGQEITPNINRLVNSGIYFKNIFEQVQGGNSSDADLMYTTSRLPVLKGSTFFRYGDIELQSLPRYLDEKGYDMLYTQAVRGSFWNYRKAWKNMIGLDNFVGEGKINMNYEKIGFTINDEDFLKQAYPYVRELKAPYYAHIVLNSSHMPFEAAEKYKTMKLPEKLDKTYLGGYIQLVNYVDTQIGELLKQLEKDGMLENTMIVIIGDHNGIHKYYEYSLEELYDDYPWCDVNGYYTVPLIIGEYTSDNKSGSVTGEEDKAASKQVYSSDVIGGQIDVMPTLAYLLGMPAEEYEKNAMGRNLLNTNRSYAIYRDGTIYGKLNDKEKEYVKNSYKISELLFEIMK